MAFSTINKSSSFMNTKLYTGTGSSNAITGVGFQPDFTWIKSRSAAENHRLFDAVRGVTKYLASNNNNIEATDATTLTAFGADGFTVSTAHPVNNNTETYVSWNWKANGAGSSNTDGSITSTVSVNTTAGFSIVKYTGTGANATIGHGLGAVPQMIIIKKLSQADEWFSYHEGLGNLKRMQLSTTAAVASSSGYWNSTTPTSSVFSIAGNGANNATGQTHIAYCFTDITGYSKCGSYIGTGTYKFVYTGFKPTWLLLKNSSAINGWLIVDSKRTTSNPMGAYNYADTDAVQGTVSYIDFLSNGFRLVNTSSVAVNQSGNTFVYAVFGQPIISNSGVVATAY